MKFAVLFVFHPLWRSAQDTSDPAIDGPGRFTGFAKPDHGFCGPSPSGSLGSLLGGPSGVPQVRTICPGKAATCWQLATFNCTSAGQFMCNKRRTQERTGPTLRFTKLAVKDHVSHVPASSSFALTLMKSVYELKVHRPNQTKDTKSIQLPTRTLDDPRTNGAVFGRFRFGGH